MGLHPGLAQWGLTQRDDTFLMQCVPTIQNSTRNRPGFFKSCTRLGDLAQLSWGVFIGKMDFHTCFRACKKIASCLHWANIAASRKLVKRVALRRLWHKFARSLAQSSTSFGTKADNLARDRRPECVVLSPTVRASSGDESIGQWTFQPIDAKRNDRLQTFPKATPAR